MIRSLATTLALACALACALAGPLLADPAGEGATAAEESAPTPEPALQPPPKPDGYVQRQALQPFGGIVQKVSRTSITILQSAGHDRLEFVGSPFVPVTGEKHKWSELRKGDVVNVGYLPGDPPQVKHVLVRPPEAHPSVAAAMGKLPPALAAAKVEFSGWVKQVDGEHIVVRSPDSVDGRRRGEARTFTRAEATSVVGFLDDWDAIKKGDRVTVHFEAEGVAKRVKVLLVGGRRPLPPGLPTRLFDPRYDRTVKDVDGIGEVPAGTVWKAPEAAGS